MTEEEAVTRLKQAAQARKAAEHDAASKFETAVVDALTAGVKPKTVAEATGYSYETVRRIARAHGIAPLREPTVTSRKKALAGPDVEIVNDDGSVEHVEIKTTGRPKRPR